MPRSYDEYMEMARRAHEAGQPDHARRLVALAREAREADQPTLPVIPEPEPEVPVFEGRDLLEDRVEQEITRRVDEAIALRLDELETPEQIAAERMRQEAAIRPEVERSLRVVSRPGVGVTTAPRTTLPFFRPTRIVVTPTGERFYQDPETGDLSKPTPGQELMESFAQQQIMSPAEAQRLIGRGEAPLGILEQVSPGEGIVEAPLGAALRSVPGYLVNILGETYYRGLGYEVKPEAAQEAAALRDQARQAEEAGNIEGAEILRQQASDILIANPMDESDLGYKIAYARDWWGLPPVISDKDDLVGIALPGVATTSTTRPAYSRDPQGRRRASDIEVPSIYEDPAGFFRAETRRLARNVSAGRTIADERRDAPDLAEYYTEAWGEPDMAYVQGMIGEVFLPIGPGLAAKGALQVARAAPGAARLAGKGVDLVRVNVAQPALEGAIRTARYVPAQLNRTPEGQALLRLSNDVAQGAKNLARANTPLELRVGMNMYMARAAELAEATGDFVSRADALIRPGAASDALVIRKVAEKVMRAADIPAPTIARAMKAIPSDVASWGEAAGKIRGAIGDEVGQEVADAISRGLKIHVPDDFVMVTDDLAVPRAKAPEIRKGAENYVRQQVVRPDSNKGMYLDRIAERLDEVDPAAATRLRAQGNLYLSGKGNEKATLNLLREAEQKLADPALVRGFRQKPLEEIIQGLSDVVRRTIDTDKYPYFADLPVGGKRRVVEGLKEYWISQNAMDVARSRVDLTSMQIGLDKANRGLTNLLDYKWLNRPFTRRLAALFGKKLDDVTKFSADTALLLRRSARGRGRAVARALKEESAKIQELAKTDGTLAKEVEEFGTVSLALDNLVEEQATNPLVNISPEELWDDVFAVMFDPRLNREVLIREIDSSSPGLRSNYPTTRTIDIVANVAEKAPDLRWSGKVSPFGRDAQNVMASVLLDGKIKEAAAKAGLARDVQRQISFAPYLQHKMRNQDPRSLLDLILDPEVQEKVAKETDAMLQAERPLGRSRMIAGTDTEYEEVIARGGAEFYELLNYAAPKYRGSLRDMAQSAGQYLLGEGQLGLRQSAKYGYFLPNLPFLVWRGLEMPFIAATQTGVGSALSGMGRIARDARRQVLRRNLTGEGITTPTGIYYSPSDLVKLAEQEGIGYTAVEAERVGGLVNDILADVNRTYGRTGRQIWDTLNPATKGFWIRTAEAMERSFRQGVFEARLAAGDTVTEAASVARRSQFDYDEVPGFLREGVLPYIYQGVSTTYKLQQEMALAALKNPRALSTYLRALDKMQEAQDPYGLEGDRSLLNLKVNVQGKDYYVRVPGAQIAESAVIAARHGDNLVTAMRNARAALKADPGKALAEIGITGGLPFAYTVVDSAIDGALKDWEDFEGADPYPTTGRRDEYLSDEKMFWSALLYFHDKDPTHTEGGWSTFQMLFDPVPKDPPADRAHPDMPQYWLTRPEGMPYAFVGRDAEGRAMFKAYEMGDRGKRNVAILRAVDRTKLHEYFPTFVAAGIGNEVFTPQPGAEYRSLYAGEYLDETGVQEAMNLFLNPVDVDYSQPEQEIRRQAEELLRARNPLNQTPE